MNSYAEIVRALREAGTVLITAHEKPDGDAVGSALGLGRILRAAGLRARVTGLLPMPSRYAFLAEPDEIEPADSLAPAAGDVLVLVDCADLQMAPARFRDWARERPLVNLDHHPTNPGYGTWALIDPAACSAGEMVHRLAREAGFPVPLPAATALWVALVTDTGRFAYENTSPRALEAAAELVRAGVRTEPLDKLIYESFTLRELRLRQRALASLDVREGGRVALISLARSDYAELGCATEDSNEFVNLPRALAGVEAALFFYEPTGPAAGPKTRVSCRTVPPFDATALCRLFGGGGHARAAGCTLDAPLPAAREAVLAKVHELWFA